MEVPKSTARVPKITWGTTFFDSLSTNEMTRPGLFDLYTFKASFRFFERARLIGTIELKMGMKMPIIKAIVVAYQSGIIDGIKPRSSVKRAE